MLPTISTVARESLFTLIGGLYTVTGAGSGLFDCAGEVDELDAMPGAGIRCESCLLVLWLIGDIDCGADCSAAELEANVPDGYVDAGTGAFEAPAVAKAPMLPSRVFESRDVPAIWFTNENTNTSPAIANCSIDVEWCCTIVSELDISSSYEYR